METNPHEMFFLFLRSNPCQNFKINSAQKTIHKTYFVWMHTTRKQSLPSTRHFHNLQQLPTSQISKHFPRAFSNFRSVRKLLVLRPCWAQKFKLLIITFTCKMTNSYNNFLVRFKKKTGSSWCEMFYFIILSNHLQKGKQTKKTLGRKMKYNASEILESVQFQ